MAAAAAATASAATTAAARSAKMLNRVLAPALALALAVARVSRELAKVRRHAHVVCGNQPATGLQYPGCFLEARAAR